MMSIPQQNLTATAWQLPHWRNRSKENQRWSVPSLAEQTHQIRVQATNRTAWKGTCWCYWQYPYSYLVEIPSAGIFTQEPSCVAWKPRADEKKKLVCLQAVKFWITVLRDGKGQPVPHLCSFAVFSTTLIYLVLNTPLMGIWPIAVRDHIAEEYSSSWGILFQRAAECFKYYSSNQNIWLLQSSNFTDRELAQGQSFSRV